MPAYDFTTLGALVGLIIAIVLIIKKVHPAYSRKVSSPETFAATLIEQQVPALAAAAMVHAGATVIDSLPHGSFFHATGGSVGMNIKDRMKLIPFEAMVGMTSTVVSVTLFLIFK